MEQANFRSSIEFRLRKQLTRTMLVHTEKEGKVAVLVLNVDDMLIASNDKEKLEKMK